MSHHHYSVFFLPILIHTHLAGWKLSRDSLDPAHILSKLDWSSCDTCQPFVSWKTLASSAERKTSDSVTISTIVLMYITNRTGANTEPCGIPFFTWYHGEHSPWPSAIQKWLGPSDDGLVKSIKHKDLEEATMWHGVKCLHEVTINHVHMAAPVQHLCLFVQYSQKLQRGGPPCKKPKLLVTEQPVRLHLINHDISYNRFE